MYKVGDSFSEVFPTDAAVWCNKNGCYLKRVGETYIIEKRENHEDIRVIRDALLSATDFLVLPDYPAEEEFLEEIKRYRQELRDITKQSGFPDSVTWPTYPIKNKIL